MKRAKDEQPSYMSSEQDDLQDIVAQLQRLQIEQSRLLDRIDRLSERNHDAARGDRPADATRPFAIGDLVRINNPRPLQAKKGKIIRIGVETNRITVETKNGSKIIRAPSNLTHLD